MPKKYASVLIEKPLLQKIDFKILSFYKHARVKLHYKNLQNFHYNILF